MTMNASPASGFREWAPRVWPLVIFVVLLLSLASAVSLVIRFWDVDMATAKVWWHTPRMWYGMRSALCQALNDYGPTPAALLAIGAGLAGLAAIFRKSWRHLGPPALYLVLAYLLGPGLLVNGLLKHSWNRARPKDVVEFGGHQHYEQVFYHDPASIGRSFPSGHASAAFYLCSLGFAAAVWGRRENMYTGLALGVAWGVLVSWSRVASGAHFLSDVFWSAALVNVVNAGVLAAMIPWSKPAKPAVSDTEDSPLPQYS